VYKHLSIPKENWSRTLLDIATPELDPLLIAICSKSCSAFAADLTQAFHERTDDMKRELRFNLDQTQIKSFREFFENMQLQVRRFARKLKDGLVYVHNSLRASYLKTD
jgi:hypothetical protein